MGYFRQEHELHTRRSGRNGAVALVLVGLIAIVFGLTYVKITGGSSLEGLTMLFVRLSQPREMLSDRNDFKVEHGKEAGRRCRDYGRFGVGLCAAL